MIDASYVKAHMHASGARGGDQVAQNGAQHQKHLAVDAPWCAGTSCPRHKMDDPCAPP